MLAFVRNEGFLKLNTSSAKNCEGTLNAFFERKEWLALPRAHLG